MSNEQRAAIKRKLDDLEDAVGDSARANGKVCEPTTFPDGVLGTDATCWTDRQFHDYAKSVCRNVAKTIERLAAERRR